MYLIDPTYATCHYLLMDTYAAFRQRLHRRGVFEDAKKQWWEKIGAHGRERISPNETADFMLFATSIYGELLQPAKWSTQEYKDQKVLEKISRKEKIRLEKADRMASKSKRKEAGMKVHLDCMRIYELKKRASREWKEFMDYYKKEFDEILRKRHRDNVRKRSGNRDALLKFAVDPRLRQKMRLIWSGPVSCHWCYEFLPNGGEVDHVVPLGKGGKNTCLNTVPSCRPCNLKKSDHMPDSPDCPVGSHLELALT